MKAKPEDGLRAMFERSQAARRSARAKVSEVIGRERSELSERSLLKRQRAARKAIAEALANTHGARSAREIAFHLSQCFEGAEFLVALQLDAGRFSKEEIEAGISDVLETLDYIWEATHVWLDIHFRVLRTRRLMMTMTTMRTFNIAERRFHHE